MHDFCLTIPYGLIVLAGGVVGYVKRGSTASLAGGAGSGILLLIAGIFTLKAFEKRKNSYFGIMIETASFAGSWIFWKTFQCLCGGSTLFLCQLITVVAVVLTWVMGQRYIETSKIMPAGVVAGLSALMTAFYLYKLATGGNHFPAKAE